MYIYVNAYIHKLYTAGVSYSIGITCTHKKICAYTVCVYTYTGHYVLIQVRMYVRTYVHTLYVCTYVHMYRNACDPMTHALLRIANMKSAYCDTV